MKRKIIICISIISVLLTGCGKIATDKVESAITEEPAKKMNPTTRLGNDVDDIMDALHFWINKKAWGYGKRVYTVCVGDDCEIMFKDFLDTELTVKIYYRTIDSYYDDPEIESRRDDNELEDVIVFYISSGQENDNYISLSLVEGEHGFASETEWVSRTKKIEDDLIYLGEEKFYFSSKEITRPDFPVSDQEKQLYLKKAKKKIEEILLQSEGTHQVYIGNFTNQDKNAEVYIISDEKELSRHTLCREILMENGIVDTDAALLDKRKASYDWTDKDTKEQFKRVLDTSILEFEVKGS